MHIEPGVVDGAKMILATGTAAAAGAYGLKLMWEDARARGLVSLAARSVIATAAVFFAFEVLPHFPVGVSEVHFIFGSTILLILGAAPAAFGLAMGLLIQGLFFAPTDLPMYFVNVTTLLVPLFAIWELARRVLPQDIAYVDLRYRDVLKLSAAFQGGVVAWVVFWVLYGEGVSAGSLMALATFGVAYMSVVLIEPLADLAILAAAKALHRGTGSALTETRLYNRA